MEFRGLRNRGVLGFHDVCYLTVIITSFYYKNMSLFPIRKAFFVLLHKMYGFDDKIIIVGIPGISIE